MARKFWFLAALIGLTSHCWAAGGSCPAGANYLNTTNPAGALVTLASLGINSCYFIAANGSDSNSGTSVSTPWLHAPGMPSCSGNCAANTPAAGVGYIFRGGDTWHFGASTSPSVGGSWGWNWSGSSQTSPIYIGVDQTWYSGSSWARPILNADNGTNACPGAGPCSVSSCAYAAIGGSYNQMVEFPGQAWNIFDNFEFTGFCWNNSPQFGANVMLGYNGGSGNSPYYFVAENNYFHGWTHTSGGTQNGAYCMVGNDNYVGSVLQFNVVDGSDSDDLSMNPFGTSDGYIIAYNDIRHLTGDSVLTGCHYIHDNIFEYMQFETDGSGHGDTLFCEAEYAGGASNPNIFYNNIWRYIGTEYNQSISYLLDAATPSGQTDYMFNNILHDNQPSSSSNYISDENTAGSWVLFNNTGSLANSGAGCLICSGSTKVTAVNNNWITSGGESSIFKTTSSVTETMPVYLTPTTATSQGYTSSNDYAPTLSTNTTVQTTGTTENSGYCADSVLHYALAESACLNGTTKGCAYNTSSHSLSCPALPADARQSAWNVGAYQFGSGSAAPAPPTNVVATAH